MARTSSSDALPLALAGFGVASAAGVGVEAFRTALREGTSLIGDHADRFGTDLPNRRGALVPEGAVREWAARALEEALPDRDRAGIGLYVGTALGAMEPAHLGAGEEEVRSRPGAVVAELGRRFELGGPVHPFSVTCASSLYALEQAAMDLHLGRVNRAICGGLDSLSRFMQAGFCALGALAPETGADGFILGEGAGFCLLEREPGPDSRGWIAGRGLRTDGTHLTSPDSEGRAMREAIRLAPERADRESGRVDCVALTAVGSPAYDRMYERVLADVFGDATPPTRTWEGTLGHMLAASGMIGLVYGALLLEEGFEDVLVLTVGFGGQNGAMLLRPADAIEAGGGR